MMHRLLALSTPPIGHCGVMFETNFDGALSDGSLSQRVGKTAATREWLLSVHEHGYDSGEIIAKEPDARRPHQEALSGGSYYQVFQRAIRPFVKPTSRILELGPGRGSWTRAFLSLVPNGEVHTLDIHDVTRFMNPSAWPGRLHCYRIDATDYRFLPNGYFDFFFSFGVLCHLSRRERLEILQQALPKVRVGGHSAHHYGDRKKLDAFGWIKGGIPGELKQVSDDESWWPPNTAGEMARTAEKAGWQVVTPDLDILGRDGLIMLCRPSRRSSIVEAFRALRRGFSSASMTG
jgi:hypothetical protein